MSSHDFKALIKCPWDVLGPDLIRKVDAILTSYSFKLSTRWPEGEERSAHLSTDEMSSEEIRVSDLFGKDMSNYRSVSLVYVWEDKKGVQLRITRDSKNLFIRFDGEFYQSIWNESLEERTFMEKFESLCRELHKEMHAEKMEVELEDCKNPCVVIDQTRDYGFKEFFGRGLNQW